MFQGFDNVRTVWSKVGEDNLAKNTRVVDDCFHLMVLRVIIASGVIIAMIAGPAMQGSTGGDLLPRRCIHHFPDTECNVWLHPLSSVFIHFYQLSSIFIYFHPTGSLPWSCSDHHRMVLNAQTYK